jgi:hypothetical protein
MHRGTPRSILLFADSQQMLYVDKKVNDMVTTSMSTTEFQFSLL